MLKYTECHASPKKHECPMTTHRLYYNEPYIITFDAQLIALTEVAGAPAAILDRSYFYPTSGGQPHDTGQLNGVPVVDVAIRESDGAVLHVLDAPLAIGPVAGRIDWARRFDHMQHHTGQHILSQAFIQVADADTVGFHLSPDSVTIDLERPDITPDQIDAAEALANRIVTENRAVRTWFPSPDELPRLALRKVPEVEGKLRVVEVADFDTNACGGTHVARTGEIGLIKVLRAQRQGDTVRVEFCCGGRAFEDYRQKHALLSQLSADLTTGFTEIPASLSRLREENKALRRDVKTLHAAALEYEAAQLWQDANNAGSGHVVLIVRAFDGRDVAEVRQLVQHLISHPATIALCGAAGEKAQLILARSDDLSHDMVAALRAGLAVWGVDRGGGRPSFAQGGGTAADLAAVDAALRAASDHLRSTER